MLSRRLFCGCLASFAFASATAYAQTGDACAVVTRDRQRALTPDMALASLREGNERVLKGTLRNCDRVAQAKATASGQAPIAAVLGCIDSRVVPELAFDQGIGDVFTARVAGNFSNVDIIGSLEFATKVSGAKAIVVLGHSECGAIKGAVDQVKLGNITAMLKNFEPAVQAVRKSDGSFDSKNGALVQKVAETNVRLTARALTRRSKILKEQVEKGEIKIAGAMHDLATGRVTWL